MTHQKVLVIDFGGQYSQLIVRRVREQNVYSEMVPWTEAFQRITTEKPKAVILSGGPKSVFEPDAPTLDFTCLDGIPTLGICYGQQLMAHKLGGTVESADHKEYGLRSLTAHHGLSKAMSDTQVWMSHGTQVTKVPEGFEVTAKTDSCPIAGMEDVARGFYGVQFHPEVTHTPDGKKILEAFLHVAGLTGDWSTENFIDEEVKKIQETVGANEKVLCAVSGGVDSSVMAALLIKAIGARAICVFVDHGLLRKGEAAQVIETFGSHFAGNLIAFHEHERFFNGLKGVKDPEAKRKSIGANFVQVFEDHANELKGCDWLAQGTLYPDVIESGSSTAAKIKTHHNVGGLPDWMRMKLIEPYLELDLRRD